jgi:hypothetical protein
MDRSLMGGFHDVAAPSRSKVGSAGSEALVFPDSALEITRKQVMLLEGRSINGAGEALEDGKRV